MDTRKSFLSFCVLFGLVAALAWAQNDPPLRAPQVDVDEDGSVNAIDVQQVINGALGLGETGLETPRQAVRLPVRRYVVAAPRGTVAVPSSLPVLDPIAGALDEAPEQACCPIVGAAYNFPRGNGRILVRRGTIVIFLLGRNAEAVWYDKACGAIATRLRVEMKPFDGNDSQWILIGEDGAGAKRCGPSVGRAKVGVRHRFTEPGLYLVRASVATWAIPLQVVTPEAIDDEATALLGCAGRAFNEVYTVVRVIAPDAEPQPEELDWQDVPPDAEELHEGELPHHLEQLEAEGLLD